MTTMPTMTFPAAVVPIPPTVNWNKLSVEVPGSKKKGQTGQLTRILAPPPAHGLRKFCPSYLSQWLVVACAL